MTVRENGAIVAVEDIVDGGADREIEDVLLLAVHVKHLIEREGPCRLLGLCNLLALHRAVEHLLSVCMALVKRMRTHVENTCILRLERHDRLASQLDLGAVLRSKPRNDFDAVRHGR